MIPNEPVTGSLTCSAWSRSLRTKWTPARSKFINRYVLTVYELKTRTAFKSLPDSAIQATGENRFEETDHGTQLNIAFKPEVGGFFGIMPKSIVTWNYHRTLTGNLARIKEILEKET